MNEEMLDALIAEMFDTAEDVTDDDDDLLEELLADIN